MCKKIIIPLLALTFLSFNLFSRFDVAEAKESVEKTIDQTKNTIQKELKDEGTTWEKITNYCSLSFKKIEKLPLPIILIIAFVFGIACSFTPCIYPMIPITLGILQSQAAPSLGRNFLLSTSYVSGMATIYAILGYFAAHSTIIFGQWLSNPWFISFLILLFLYLAFSMFGFYEIYMPRFLQRNSNLQVRGSILYSFLFGAVSGTAASPCLTPALAMLLSFVAKRASPFIGFLTLFLFAFGMGILLIIVGTFSNTLTSLPRAGAWMNEIKKFFGFLLVGTSIHFLHPLMGSRIPNILYLILLLVVIGYYSSFFIKKFHKKTKPGWTLIELMVVVGIILFLASIAMPRFFSYRAKAMKAEVATMLASLHTAELAYWAEHGEYTTDLNELKWKPEGNFNYTYGFFFSGAKEGVNYFVGKLKVAADKLGNCKADRDTLIARAAGNPEGANTIDVWTIDQSRNITNSMGVKTSSDE